MACWHLARVGRELEKLDEIAADGWSETRPVNKQGLEAILLSCRETRAMGIFVQALPEVSPQLARRFDSIRHVIYDAFGRTTDDSSAGIAQGGAVKACADAIASIDAVLPNSGNTLKHILDMVELFFKLMEAQIVASISTRQEQQAPAG
jgi:hypothetical protein